MNKNKIQDAEGMHRGTGEQKIDSDKEAETDPARKEILIRNHILDIFLTVNDDEMYSEVLKIILELTDSKYGVFGYIDENGALVVPSMTKGVWDECQVPNKTYVFPREFWGNSSWPRCIYEKKPIYMNEYSEKIPEGHIQITRHISQPIIQDKVIGLLQVANKDTDYTKTDMALMQKMANLIAPVLNERLKKEIEEKKRLLVEKQLKDQMQSLEEIVKQRTQELKKTHNKLMQQEKLVVIGQIAGSIGHELRNPLASMKNSVYLINMIIEDPEPDLKIALQTMDSEINTSLSIINNLLDYARAKPPIMMDLDIISCIEEKLTKIKIPENINLIFEKNTGPLLIHGDSSQLHQVFENLIVNAIQAMPNGGNLLIEIRKPEKKIVTVSVKDTGIGISEENINNMFDPLFTTKVKGIGLGLTIVKMILDNHSAEIQVDSQVNKGTTFTITFNLAGE